MIGTINTVTCQRNQNVSIRVMPGHFAMTHSHTNYYVDIIECKQNQSVAQEAANTLAEDFAFEQQIDTIICMDGSEVIGAGMAAKLGDGSFFSKNGRKSIYVVWPENENSNRMIFRDNAQPMIRGRKVLILCGSVLTGKNVRQAMECVSYYGGEVVGVATVFSLLDEIDGLRVAHLFSGEDIPGYQATDYSGCPMCKAGQKIDALANCFGYSVL